MKKLVRKKFKSVDIEKYDDDALFDGIDNDEPEIEEIEKKEKHGFFEYCPIFSFILFIIALISGVIHIVSLFNSEFADSFNYNISSSIRFILAHITGWFPFSLAETIVICIPVIFGVLIYLSITISKKTGSVPITRYFCILLSVISLMYSLFVCGFGVGYHGSTLEAKLKLDRHDVTADELYNTALAIREEINKYADETDYINKSFSVMPYTIDTMIDKLNDAYAKAAEKYDFIKHFDVQVKCIALSKPMTYTHISGVYSYFTGEANLNINFPDYTLPYTAAHEMSHQRGIAREDEANFMAFLVCLESDDSYIRYSGYVSLYEYVINALFSADTELYYDVISGTDIRILYEESAYGNFFEKYRKSVASTVSTAVNDTFLKSQGQSDGSKSYGRVVDLAVSYFAS